MSLATSKFDAIAAVKWSGAEMSVAVSGQSPRRASRADLRDHFCTGK
jgi:hypothetical protein